MPTTRHGRQPIAVPMAKPVPTAIWPVPTARLFRRRYADGGRRIFSCANGSRPSVPCLHPVVLVAEHRTHLHFPLVLFLIWPIWLHCLWICWNHPFFQRITMSVVCMRNDNMYITITTFITVMPFDMLLITGYVPHKIQNGCWAAGWSGFLQFPTLVSTPSVKNYPAFWI
jgi:hypothetical protein